MKYLALLKDSVREAIDTKVFYVMAGLSGLVILVVASLGFTPRPATDLNAELETTLNLDLASLVRAAREQQTNPVRHDSSAAFHIVSVEAIDGQLNRPTSSLRFLVRARFPTSRETDEARQDPAPTLRFFAERFASYGDAKMLSVTLARPAAAPPSQEGQPDPRELFFDITTQPTKYTLAAWPHDMTVLFGAFKLPLDTPQPVGLQVLLIEQVLVNFLGASVAVLVSIIITGFFIPNMLRKGTIDMLLVKPIHRPTLLIYKYIGGLTFIFLNTALAIGGVWLVFGLRTGLWSPGLLLMIGVTTFFFAILYAVSVLFAVLSRSPIVAILMSCLAWFIFFLAGQAYFLVDFYVKEGKIPDGWYVRAVNGIHFVLPRPKDMDRLAAQVLAHDLAPKIAVMDDHMNVAPTNWKESVTVSVIFIAVMIGLACWRFSTRDY